MKRKPEVNKMIKLYKKEGQYYMSDEKKELYDPVLLIERLAGKVYIEMEKTYPNMPPLVSDLAEDENKKLGRSISEILKSEEERADEAGRKMLNDIDTFLTRSLFGQDALDKINERRVSKIVEVLSSHAPYQREE